jgi:hypothetical protein
MQPVLTLCGTAEDHRPATTINNLPDNVMLEIFDYYRTNDGYFLRTVWNWNWHVLVHMCQRWRQIIFASPTRLDLQILCTSRTPVRKNLSIWTAFPIVIDYCSPEGSKRPIGQGNVVAALKHPKRVCYINLGVTGPLLGKLAIAMQKPFPVLTRLEITSKDDGNVPVLPAKFLQASAPRLQRIYLHGIPYPTLPTLLLSASELVSLRLYKIPPTGYISPEAMVASLAALPRLERLFIEFQSATSRPDQTRPPPVIRTVLPSLHCFQFSGASEYLEDLVARIDSPHLDQIRIVYLNQLVDFQVPHLSKFIDRSVGPKLTRFKHVQVTFFDDYVTFNTHPRAHIPDSDERRARISILCQGIDWQVSHIALVLSHFSTTLSTVAHLKLMAYFESYGQSEDEGVAEWLLLLRQFSTVKTLHVSQVLAEHVGFALNHITGEMVAEVLPSLHSIYLEGELESSVKKFVTIRRLSGRPVTVFETSGFTMI